MLIAFEFDDSTLRAVIGQNPNRQFRVTGTIELPLDIDAEALGSKLKDALREQGVQKGDAIAVLSRWQTEIRELTVPPVPDDELPDLVRFQARNEFMSLTDDWPLDYIRLDQPAEGPHRVLAAAIAPEMLERLQTICTAAGVSLKHIVLQPLATLDLFMADHAQGAISEKLLIRPGADQADLSIAVDGNMRVTRSIRFAPDATPEKRASMLISESRRTLAAAKSRMDRDINRAVVLGPEKRFKALGGDLTKSLGFNVEFMDGFDTIALGHQFVRPDQPANYAALLGSLARQDSAEKHAIDFLSPKRTVVRRPNRNRWLTIAGIALAASLLLVAFVWSSLGGQQQTIDELNATLKRINSSNQGDGRRPSVDQIMSEVGRIDEWKLNDINWLSELKQLSDRMLTSEDVIIDSLNASSRRNSPQIILASRVASIQKENELINSLVGRPYSLKQKRSEEDSTDAEYPLGLKLDATFAPNIDSMIQQVNEIAAKSLQNQNPPAEAPPR